MKTIVSTVRAKTPNHAVAADVRRRIPRSAIEVRPPRHLGGYFVNGLLTILLAVMLVGAALHATAQPVITQQPRNQTNIAGTTAIFSDAEIGRAHD